MNHPNLDLVNQFFQAYGQRDLDSLRRVLAEDAKWTALGQHPLSGARNGFDEVIAFFDRMGTVMGQSNIKSKNWSSALVMTTWLNVSMFGRAGRTGTISIIWPVCFGDSKTLRLLRAGTSSQTPR